MTKPLLVIAVTGGLLLGCAMFSAWKTIPPPGGCDQCHQLEISANWVASYRPVQLNDETGQYYWQKPESVLGKAAPEMLEQQKVTEQRCFRCHKSPDRAHQERQGRYHH
jgi:hypothetical protein